MSVKFHLPGLRNNFPLNMLLVDLMENLRKCSGRE